MPERPSGRALPLPGLYAATGECVKCGGSLPKAVRSGLAAYFCSDCWLFVQARASDPDPAFQWQRAFDRVEDD